MYVNEFTNAKKFPGRHVCLVSSKLMLITPIDYYTSYHILFQDYLVPDSVLSFWENSYNMLYMFCNVSEQLMSRINSSIFSSLY